MLRMMAAAPRIPNHRLNVWMKIQSGRYRKKFIEYPTRQKTRKSRNIQKYALALKSFFIMLCPLLWESIGVHTIGKLLLAHFSNAAPENRPVCIGNVMW